MAEGVVSFVVETLGGLLIEEAKLIHGVGGQVENIYDELKAMQAFLKDADTKQAEDESIRVWVDSVRTLAYDASDVLETFLFRVQSKKVGGIKNKLKRCICILNEWGDRHMVGIEIQNIQSKISELNSRVQTYGISLSEATSSTRDTLIQVRRTYSHTIEDDFLGFEEDVETLVKHLVNDGEGCYSSVSICGLGGSGKSTIARQVYNHTKVKRRFEAFAWICVSQKWKAIDILQQILTKITPQEKDEIKISSDAEMIKKLFELQQTKSCLIVVDDIWDKDAWDCIKEAFPKNNKTSKLLLTSRNKDVANHINPYGFHYEPRGLSQDEAWMLLKKKAFTSVHHYPDPKELEEIEKLGMEMVGHCKGLPLGVVVLGGILAHKRDLVDWKNVHRNIKSVIRRGESREKARGGVSEILELSYSNLPYYLKPCFLYLSKYREDADIDTQELYQLWMAEGMVLSDGKGEGETMMDVAESYLDELAQRNMVQVKLNDEEDYEFGRFMSCRMHDMIRDLCLSKAKDEHFFHNNINLDNKNGVVGSTTISSSITSARRVVIYFEGDNDGGIPVSTYSPRLRSLLIENDDESSDGRLPRMVKSHLSDFKLLRCLAIEGFSAESVSSLRYLISDNITLPNAIRSLIHLRYLSLQNSDFIMFPTCIRKLKHLQTLNLRGCLFSIFSRCTENVLSKMSKLQHLYLPAEIPYWRWRNKLMLDKSINLEILDDYDPSYCRVEDLMKFINLRKLGARVTSNHLEATKDIISYLSSTKPKNIRYTSLKIVHCKFVTDEWHEIFIKLFSFSSVNRLYLNGPISIRLPIYNNSSTLSSRMTQLSLYNSKLEEDPMSILEAFLNLIRLDLWRAFQGTQMSCSSNGFPRLRSLHISSMDNLESFKLENGAMPKLSELCFRNCKSMKTIPDGLRLITTLQTLKIIWMPDQFEEKIKAVQNGEKGDDFDKIGHVPSIIIE